VATYDGDSLIVQGPINKRFDQYALFTFSSAEFATFYTEEIIKKVARSLVIHKLIALAAIIS
jgi:hypothetical protein